MTTMNGTIQAHNQPMLSYLERFLHPYKDCFVLLPTDVGSHNPPSLGPASSQTLVPFSNRYGTPQIYPLRDPVSLLGHRLVSTPFRDSAFSLTHHPVSDPRSLLHILFYYTSYYSANTSCQRTMEVGWAYITGRSTGSKNLAL